MTMDRTLPQLAAIAGALLLIAATPIAHHAGHAVPARAGLVSVTPQGSHLLGSPEAKVRLTEYISYTCSHCAHFHEQATATLQTSFVGTGKGSVEIVPYIRNPIDLAAALLVECGGPARFVRLHDIFLNTQAQWMAKVSEANAAQQQRWDNGTVGSRMRAIAGDLGFYQIMEDAGIGRAQADRCLNDDAAAKRLAAQTEAATTAGVLGTPGFAINGVVLTGTYDWDMLAPQLQARL